MSLRTTVSGSTPGLIQIGTMILVKHNGAWEQRVVTALPDEVGEGLIWACKFGRECGDFKLEEVRIDLYDSKTCRVHAAWWLGARIDSTWPESDSDWFEIRRLCDQAERGFDMTLEEIDTMVTWINRYPAS